MNFLILFVKCFSMNFHEFKNYNKVIIDIQHKQNWKRVMNNKMQLHRNNNIWKLIESIFKNRKILIDKWVYKIKRKINEKIIKYKTRWCIRNFKQIKNLDYHKIFSIVIKFINYKVIFVIIVVNNWKIE